jgi:hypothetical protein
VFNVKQYERLVHHQAAGYDGIIIKGGETRYPELVHDQYVVWNKDKIKIKTAPRVKNKDNKDKFTNVDEATRVQAFLEKIKQVKAYQKNYKGKLVNVRTYTRDVDVSSIDKGPRIFRGEPVKSEEISKSRTGKIGEALTLHQKGGMPVNAFLDRKENNLAFDVINLRKRKLYEVKAGLISVGLKAKNKYDGMKWRLTKGEPSKYEKNLLKKMKAKAKLLHNKDKNDAIIQRKMALKADIENKTGVEFTIKTITYIVNPTTKQADMYEFDGLHKEIRWRHPDTARAYKRSVKWK